MHTANSVIIKAPRQRIFEITSDLENWTPMLPHYRYIRFHERSENKLKNVVSMACWRGWIPLSWKSIHEIKPDVLEVHFTHLRAFTKGMVVIWRYDETPDGVNVSITHDLNFRVPFLAPLMEPLIGRVFVEPVACRTLATFKKILEEETGK
jgi:ribosome-associated toxin RatA of RatAB toxin-antitoxin module